MRFVGVVSLVWAAAVMFTFVATWLLRSLTIDSPYRFWIVLVALLVISFPVFYRFAPDGGVGKEKIVLRCAFAMGLSVATYFIAIYVAFAIGTLIFGG